jgi:hypothetical protein
MLRCSTNAEAMIYRITETGGVAPGSQLLSVYMMGPQNYWTVVNNGDGELGLTIKKYGSPPSYIYPHPSNANVALAAWGDSARRCKLFITNDMGDSWTEVATGTAPYWVKRTDGKIVFLHFDTCGQASQLVSSEWEITRQTLTQTVSRDSFTDLYAADWTGYVTSTDDHEQVFFATSASNELLVSRDSTHWVHAFVPHKSDLVYSQFTVYGVDDGAIWLNARASNGGTSAVVGDLFVSGNDTEFFSLSLDANLRAPSGNGIGGYGDFEKLQSVDGVFFANRAADPTYGTNIDTYVTFDMGGKWNRLNAPAKNRDGSPTNCKPSNGCYLNLFGLADEHNTLDDWGGFGRFYSVPSAVGIMFGTGNLGAHLDLNGVVNTYFSRDAGVTWEEVTKGRFAYEIADHGALLGIVARDVATNSLQYTWDEGLNWIGCNFTDQPLHIENLITETQFASQSFLLYGAKQNKAGETIGVLFSANFDGLLQRTCQGVDTPDTPGSDYETFDVEFESSKCILGMDTVYVRRKRDAKCFNPDNRPVNKRSFETCVCTEEDFECGPCFKYDSASKDCKQMPNCAPPTQQQQCEQGCFYFNDVSQVKYMRIAGDKCRGGEKWESLEKAMFCPNKPGCRGFPEPPGTGTDKPVTPGDGNGGPSGTTVFLAIVVVLAVLLVGFILFVCFTKKPASVYAVLSRCRPGGSSAGGKGKYAKLNLGDASSDTTSFFADDELGAQQK